MVEVAGADGVGIEIDTSEVDDPGELRGVMHDDLFRAPSGWKRQLHGLDPLRTRGGGTFLKEGLTLGAVDEPLEGHRAAPNTAERPFGDRHVIADHVELRVTGLRKEDLVRIADRDLATGDLEDFLFRRRHGDYRAGDGRL